MNNTVEKLLHTSWDGSDDWTHSDEFSDRLENSHTCNHTLDGSKQILRDMGYSETETVVICEWFELNGGYCDCEVGMNVVMRESLRFVE